MDNVLLLVDFLVLVPLELLEPDTVELFIESILILLPPF
jgi:hypothetical protein